MKKLFISALFCIFPAHIAVSLSTSDMMWDFALHQESSCNASGDRWGGLTCSSGPSGMTTAERLQKEAAEARVRGWQEATDFFNGEISQFVDMFPSIAEQYLETVSRRELPIPKPMNIENWACLRASIGALLLLEHRPTAFKRFSEILDGDGAHRMWQHHLNRHANSLFSNASEVLKGMYGRQLDLSNSQHAALVRNLILSEVKPSLEQMLYLVNNVDLIETSTHQYMMSSAYRIGFYSLENTAIDYPFTDLTCHWQRNPNIGYQSQAILYSKVPTIKKLGLEGFEDALDNFTLEGILP